MPEYTLKIQNGYRVYKLWIVMRNKFGTGVVCGGISKTGTTIKGVHGIPAAVVGQPGHAAFIVYSRNSNGEGYWGIDNDVSGWAYSGSGAAGGAIPGGGRGLLGWSTASYAKGSTGTYVPLAQDVLNRNDIYEQSQKFVYLADSYTDLAKKEEMYEKALEIQPLNLNAWEGLIQTYKSQESKTEEQYLALAKRMAETLKCYPLPMYQMTDLIKSKLTSIEAQYQFTLLQSRILKEGSTIPNDSTEVLQPGITRTMANYLLGNIDTSIATFSFDGEDAGKIVLSSRYDGNGVRWDYSIDGKNTWKEVSFTENEEHKLQLTQEEIAKMTADNDLYVHIVGVNYEEENLYKIDIQESAGLPTTLYANDLENKLIAATPLIEWKLNENDNWTSYGTQEPNLTGDKTIIVRMGATGVRLPSSSTTYTFTEDNQPDTRKYIPIEHLSIHAYSTQSKDNGRPYFAPNAIDGNINTLWHTDFGQNVLQQPIKPFISIKLDEPKNISALEFTQRKYPGKPGDPDNIRNARVYVSTDGESWILGGSIQNCATYGDLYAVEFDKPVYGEYVKIEMDTTNMFASLALVNLYEDTTITTIANFAFSGEKAGKILIVDEFKGANWQYSLDGGTTWKAGSGDEHQLTDEEIGKIDAVNKIKIRILEGNKQSTIEIREQDAPTITAYANDLENRLIGITNTDNLEWKTVPNVEGTTTLVNNQGWSSYADDEPIVEGDTKLLIRKKATGILLPSEAVEFVFTADNQPNTAKYVSIRNISSVNASSTTVPSRGEEARFAVDGLPTTMWHSSRTTTTMHDPRWITIELDEPRYISKIEYVRKQSYAYGIPRDGKVLVSMDGENWTEVLVFENLYDATTPAELVASDDRKMLEMTKVEQAKYVKIECTKSCDNVHGNRDGVPMDYFFSAAMINLFEDLTKIEKVVPTAEIEYSTRELTNQNVTATLVNESTPITVTNNNGSKTYTFEDNGEFTFEFTDNKGTTGTATAKVDWICKTLPTATVVYSTTELTNQDVTATVTFDRNNVKIVNDAGEVLETITTGNALKAGDLDEDTEITINDLAVLKLTLIGL